MKEYDLTAEEFIMVIIKNRFLTTQGVGVKDGSKEIFEEDRADMASCYEEANACEQFLRTCRRTNQVNKAAGASKDILQTIQRISGLKHMREGALILAAIHLGLKIKRVRNRTSVYMNIELNDMARQTAAVV